MHDPYTRNAMVKTYVWMVSSRIAELSAIGNVKTLTETHRKEPFTRSWSIAAVLGHSRVFHVVIECIPTRFL